jgi:hypothetical protein
MLRGVLILLAVAALFGWAGEMDRRDAREAGAIRGWSMARWSASLEDGR